MDLPVDFSCLKNQKNVAVGLSGCGDSMALVHMLNQWAATNGARIHALTVDHNLRDNSHDEAQSVGAIIKNFENTTHSILQWDDGKNEKTSLMEKARAARYDLMIEYCKTHNIKT
jgi:tRNA(Ile)-lysidine synthase